MIPAAELRNDADGLRGLHRHRGGRQGRAARAPDYTDADPRPRQRGAVPAPRDWLGEPVPFNLHIPLPGPFRRRHALQCLCTRYNRSAYRR